MKKIAIIVVNSTCFDNVAISLKNNEERINWLADVDADIRIEERDNIMVFDKLSDFINDYNCGACHSADDFLVDIKYDSDKNFVEYIRSTRNANAIDNAECEAMQTEAIQKAKKELAECIALIHNCNDLQEVYDLIDSGRTDMSFGNGNYSTNDFVGICYGSIQFDVLCCYPGIMIAADRVIVYRDGEEVYCGYIDEEGVNGVKSQDSNNIYLKPDEPNEKSAEVDVNDYYPFDDQGGHYFEINSSYWLHIMVQKDWDCFSWVLYDNNFKVLDRNYNYGLSIDTWTDFCSELLGIAGELRGKIMSMICISPSIFQHLKNA